MNVGLINIGFNYVKLKVFVYIEGLMFVVVFN